jgi:hypothetical protein
MVLIVAVAGSDGHMICGIVQFWAIMKRQSWRICPSWLLARLDNRCGIRSVRRGHGSRPDPCATKPNGSWPSQHCVAGVIPLPPLLLERDACIHVGVCRCAYRKISLTTSRTSNGSRRRALRTARVGRSRQAGHLQPIIGWPFQLLAIYGPMRTFCLQHAASQTDLGDHCSCAASWTSLKRDSSLFRGLSLHLLFWRS